MISFHRSQSKPYKQVARMIYVLRQLVSRPTSGYSDFCFPIYTIVKNSRKQAINSVSILYYHFIRLHLIMLPTPRLTTSSKNLLGLVSQAPKLTPSAVPSRTFSTTPTAKKAAAPILLQDKNGFGFARSNPRPQKPRGKGVTEIRGPYYSVCMT